jgi:hypothetical protein
MAKKTVTSEVIVLDDFRASFVQVDVPKEVRIRDSDPAKDPRFSMTFLGDPKNPKNMPGLEQLLKEARRIAQEKWGVDPLVIRQKAYSLGFAKKAPEGDEDGIKFGAFYNGNVKKAKRPEFEGLWVLSAHNTVNGFLKVQNNKSYTESQRAAAITRLENEFRPLIANRRGVVVMPGDPQYPYSGCYVRGKVTLWTSEHDLGGKQIIAGLRSIQFLRPGEPFARAPIDAEKEFEKLEDDDSAADAFADADQAGASENWD